MGYLGSSFGDKRLRYFVYRLHAADGEVLYVGRSCDVPARIKAHVAAVTHPDPSVRQDKPAWVPWVRSVSMFGPFNWAEAVREERLEIKRLEPRGNVAGTERHPNRKAVA